MLALRLSKVTLSALFVAISVCYISCEDLLDVDDKRLGKCSIVLVTVSSTAYPSRPMLYACPIGIDVLIV